jgi:hypothetical protein
MDALYFRLLFGVFDWFEGVKACKKTTKSPQDKALGTIFGSALGVCINLYTEFLPAASAATAYLSRKFTLDPPTPFCPDSHRDKFEQAT